MAPCGTADLLQAQQDESVGKPSRLREGAMRYGGVGSHAEIFEAIMLSMLNSHSRKERRPYHGELSLATLGQNRA